MANCFWFYSILAGWSTWQWVFLNFSQNFWSFDTPDTPGCASAVFAVNEIWNRLKRFLPVCIPDSRVRLLVLDCETKGWKLKNRIGIAAKWNRKRERAAISAIFHRKTAKSNNFPCMKSARLWRSNWCCYLCRNIFHP